MSISFDDVRKWIEIFYFISGPVLVIFGAWGLKQITIAKKNARITAKREAFRLAAERCTHFMDHIIPKMNKYDEIARNIQWDWMDDAKVEILNDRFKLTCKIKSFDWDKIRPRVSAGLEVANCLEGFAIFFTTGIASEIIAFSSAGKTYCDEVRDLLPLIALGAGNQKHYKNLLALFFLWHNRIQSENLRLDKARIEEQIQEIGEKEIIPVGLEK
jgi:hypothetical protein